MAEQSLLHTIDTYRWIGSSEPHLDVPETTSCGRVVIGSYGGHTGAGATKNEDGALVWCAEDGSWEFVLLLDGHNTTQSGQLIQETFENEADTLLPIFNQPVETVFSTLQQQILNLFQAPGFRAACRQVQGETACMISLRKGQFLWWLCIGDCTLYLFHPELAQRKQYALNQRSFYEWIGYVNTFDLPVPCYTTGIRELRTGENRIVMITDGLLEFGSRPFEDPQRLYRLFTPDQAGEIDLQPLVHAALMQIHREQARDSATIVAWTINNPHAAIIASS
ncbi:protein phosphatase 2C domain-containing protein [Tengunoibacter tsumagoiensis]|uniref:Protein phosphatase n=1 Tax=Tengunoibacter tsumagoiensis TaxID=2014871 RepID=A0A401ZVD0_9CHLR|nr:protein phosphatase 2C domain-containing protein [Tengunoibacter tsumagoiensis]GCE10746.1 protein phosphatase [Tengunoibacter tsumagoiensis]